MSVTPTHPTRDEVLFWLNDHIGRTVTVEVRDDLDVPILVIEDELRHWWHEDREDLVGLTAAEADELAGCYTVGGATLDLREVAWIGSQQVTRVRDDSRFTLLDRDGNFPGDELRVQLDNNTVMTIRVGERFWEWD